MQEIDRVGFIGQDAADFSGGGKNVFRLMGGEKIFGGPVIGQIKFGAASQDKPAEALFLQAANQGLADQAPVAGHIYGAGFIH